MEGGTVDEKGKFIYVYLFGCMVHGQQSHCESICGIFKGFINISGKAGRPSISNYY
jgi:hypothetical protein